MSINYQKLEQRFEKIGRLENIINILNWDMACNIKKGSQESRTLEIIDLKQIIKKLLTSKETKNLLSQAQQEQETLNSWQQANLREITSKIQSEEIIPEEIQNNLILATTKSELIWRQAKKNNDYNSFKPYFQKVLNYTKEIANLRSQKLGVSLYDSLIDQYDTGMTTTKIKEKFNVIKEKLPHLMKTILQKQEQEKHLYKDIAMPLEKQKKLNQIIMPKIGFNCNYGRLDESIHPFCGGTPYDVRLTSNYNINNFLDSFLATIHEVGHGLYAQNLPQQYKNQPVGTPRSFSFDESQSLLMEKQVAKSQEFLTYLVNILKTELNFYNPSLTPQNLFKQANQVKPDFVRIYADEVTYPFHVILRFEIEELLISDQLSLDDLPHFWNFKMKEYLGITVPNVGLGCLQDIHWPQGSFGYFPSYLNGAILASMIMKNVKQANPNIKNGFKTGKFETLNQYLNQNIRNWGSFYTNQEFVFKATGMHQINPETFLQYLENKYLNN
ncbi:carboxypeptidase M32 [Candidatus Phytoplasma tritici]|uniref:carboxypeptidase M32 n=1 Tax=Candidatus Phytoplasma tritici TaxID=321961 RepID=UPI00041967E4|nr:carboxypeptidase M32 [Candidatus Phytoplasma tritici]